MAKFIKKHSSAVNGSTPDHPWSSSWLWRWTVMFSWRSKCQRFDSAPRDASIFWFFFFIYLYIYFFLLPSFKTRRSNLSVFKTFMLYKSLFKSPSTNQRSNTLPEYYNSSSATMNFSRLAFPLFKTKTNKISRPQSCTPYLPDMRQFF